MELEKNQRKTIQKGITKKTQLNRTNKTKNLKDNFSLF